MADDELQAAADRLAEIEPVFDEPRPKLPQARHYLRAAKWGFDQMVKHRHQGSAFVFHVVGVVTFLRSIPFALYRRDRKLSPTHDTVIREWWARTQPTTTPVLRYVKRARDQALKEGGLNSIAVRSDLRIGEGPNAEVIRRDYDVDHIDENERHDMLAKLRDAFDWFEAQLSEIETRLPAD